MLRETFLEVVQLFFLLYVGLNLAAAVLLVGMDRLSSGLIRETALVVCLVDALFLGALTVITGGFDSILFWLFLGLQMRNALSLPQPWRQIPLNLWVTGCYVGAGFGEELKQQLELAMLDPKTQQLLYPAGVETPTEPVVLRVVLLLLMGACCYGVEVLLDKQRRVEEEAREFGQRQRQLESAGRLAAEIAHQLKNPLAIINNAAFTLQRTVKEGKTITQQIRIIRDEVERSDRIITELMGYARLVEGHVERLDVVEELERAVDQVLPSAAPYGITVARDYRAAVAAAVDDAWSFVGDPGEPDAERAGSDAGAGDAAPGGPGPGRRDRGNRDSRQWSRDGSGGFGTCFRGLLLDQGRGDGAGAGDCEAQCRDLWWPDPGGVGAWPGDAVHLKLARADGSAIETMTAHTPPLLVIDDEPNMRVSLAGHHGR